MKLVINCCLFIMIAACSAYAQMSLPNAIDFRLKTVYDKTNNCFTAFLSVKALLCRTPIKIDLLPSDGVTIISSPKRLKGRLRLNKSFKFKVQCKVSPSCPKPCGLNVRLRYKLPVSKVQQLLKSSLEDDSQNTVLESLRRKGSSVFTLYRCVLLNE